MFVPLTVRVAGVPNVTVTSPSVPPPVRPFPAVTLSIALELAIAPISLRICASVRVPSCPVPSTMTIAPAAVGVKVPDN